VPPLSTRGMKKAHPIMLRVPPLSTRGMKKAHPAMLRVPPLSTRGMKKAHPVTLHVPPLYMWGMKDIVKKKHNLLDCAHFRSGYTLSMGQCLSHFVCGIFQCGCNQEFHAGVFENFSSFDCIGSFKANDHRS
jgi:hypothetical protein